MHTILILTLSSGWIPNTDLSNLDLDTIGSQPEKGKSKSLNRAYQVAAEKHDIGYFKLMLQEHQQALQAEAEAKAAKKNAKSSKSKAKAAAAPADEDEEMPDAGDNMDFNEDDADDAPKSKSKKRKKDAESDAEDAKVHLHYLLFPSLPTD